MRTRARRRARRSVRVVAALVGALAALVVALLVTACDHDPPPWDPAAVDATTASDAAVDVHAFDADAVDAVALADHTPYPQVTYGGGPVLSAPHLVVVTFAGDPMGPEVADFVSEVTASDWFAAVTAGACDDAGCVGAARRVDTVTLPLPPPLDDDGGTGPNTVYDQASVQQLLHDALASGAVPAPDANSLYILSFPLGILLTQLDAFSNVLTGCSNFPYWHHQLYIGDIAFAGGGPGYDRLPMIALPRCSRLPVDITVPLGRALVATTTDPAGTAYVLRDQEGWNAFYGTELPDLCDQDPPIVPDDPDADTLPRSWSNAAALTGDPCIPGDGQSYFAAIPRVSGTLYLEPTEVRTLPVDAFAEDDAPFDLEVADLDAILSGTATLNVQLDRTTASNGVTVNVTLSFQNPPPERLFGVFIVFAKRGTTTHGFPVAVRYL